MLKEQDFLKIEELINNSNELDAESKQELLNKLSSSNFNGYGLNFIRSIEDIEKETYPYNKDNFIFLEEDMEKEIFKGDEFANNILFEGDNLESLKILNSTHKGKVDVIYIDPPYNTGNKDFIYNDSFVSNDDGFKHSKWLSFMEKRLKLAYNLLADDGVVFISIDDNEYANLKLLCDAIFNPNNVETVIWEKVGTGNAGAGKMKITHRIRRDHEYIICAYKKKELVVFNKYKDTPNFLGTYGNPDNDPRGAFKAGNISKTEEKSLENGKNYYTVVSPDGKKTYTRQWHMSEEEFIELDSDGRIYWGKSGHGVPQLKIFLNEKREVTTSSVFKNIGSATLGSSQLKKIGGLKFNNPKPLELIKYLIGLFKNKDATILDFFAGSGTTGHAVLELNKEDGGNRKFILCTNNENNICEGVTYQRISSIINGYTTPKDVFFEGIPANLNYFKTDYVYTRNSQILSDVDVIPYIELKEGVRYNLVDGFEYCSSKNKYVFLVETEEDMLKVQEFLQNNIEKEVVIYCNNQSTKNKYFNTEFYQLFKSVDMDTILNISKMGTNHQ